MIGGYSQAPLIRLQRSCTCWDSFLTLTAPDRSRAHGRGTVAEDPSDEWLIGQRSPVLKAIEIDLQTFHAPHLAT